MDEKLEEMEKDIAVRMAMAKGVAGSMNNGVEGWLSEYLYNAGYRKIPEGAVVLTQEMTYEYRKDVAEVKFLKKKIIKETAEKFIERQKELEEALLDMVVQFCQMGEYGKLQHAFMSAEEQAFDVLDINYGEKVDDVYERFNKKWNRPIDEICKELIGGNNGNTGR